MFAQDIECGAKPARVQAGYGPQRLIGGFSSDVPVCDPPDDTLWNGRQRPRNESIEQCHKAYTLGL
jgi:hypothetical protein